MPLDEQGDPAIPHGTVAETGCDGALMVEERGKHAHITCSKCGEVIAVVPATRSPAVLAELSSRSGNSARCPHCDALNVFPGLSRVYSYICHECGVSVVVKKRIQ